MYFGILVFVIFKNYYYDDDYDDDDGDDDDYDVEKKCNQLLIK